MHGVEKVFALGVDAHAQLVALAPQTLLQLGSALTRARRVGDDHHRKLSLHDRLIDVLNAATRFGKYLRNGVINTRVVHPKHGDDHAGGRTRSRSADGGGI